jgi:tetratricopeptide (TPR) repeat protein
VRILPLPSEAFSVADTRVDEVFQEVATAIKSAGDAILNEAIVVSVDLGGSGLAIHLVGIGERHRRHQFINPVAVNDLLSEFGLLIHGAVRNGLLPSTSIDVLRLLQADLVSSMERLALQIGNTYASSGRLTSARSCWRTALRITGQRSFPALIGMGVSYREEGDLEDADDFLLAADNAAGSPKEHAIARYHRGLVAVMQEDITAARQHFSTCVDAYPACGMGWIWIAHSLAAVGDRKAARLALETCLSCDDEIPGG